MQLAVKPTWKILPDTGKKLLTFTQAFRTVYPTGEAIKPSLKHFRGNTMNANEIFRDGGLYLNDNYLDYFPDTIFVDSVLGDTFHFTRRDASDIEFRLIAEDNDTGLYTDTEGNTWRGYLTDKDESYPEDSEMIYFTWLEPWEPAPNN